jgi:hypothetical protein
LGGGVPVLSSDDFVTTHGERKGQPDRHRFDAAVKEACLASGLEPLPPRSLSLFPSRMSAVCSALTRTPPPPSHTHIYKCI